MRLFAFLVFVTSCTYAADVCNPANLIGPYTLQLSGTTTISGTAKPATSLARVVFDANGNLSGTASSMFDGFLLGNPVTGTYTAKPDCTISWKLQDDSGAFQNFSGTLSTDLMNGQFKQTDPGGAQRGTIRKMPTACSAADLQPTYAFTISGTRIPMQGAGVSRAISAKGNLDLAKIAGVKVDSDCTVNFAITVTADNYGPETMQFRGFLVNRGKEILAIQTDPGAMVTARLTAQ